MTQRKRRPGAGKKHQGTITVRPNGVVQFRVMVNGRRITTYGRTETEARAKAYERVPLLGRTAKGVKFSEAFNAWCAVGFAELDLAPTTFDSYRYLLQSRVLPMIGDRNLESLTADVMDSVLQVQHGSKSTRRSVYYALGNVMRFAFRQKWVGRNVMRDVTAPTAGKSAKRDISTEEALRMLDAARGDRLEVAVWLGLGAGIRRGEMLGLRWIDVDLDAGVAHIVGNVTRSSAGLIVGDPKTDRGKRRMPLPPEVVAALRAHRKRQAVERLAAGSAWVDSGMVITNEVGGLTEPRRLSRVWARWAKAANLDDTGTHVGRHYAASTLVASGMASVADIAEMLGHSPEVLLNTYAAASSLGQRSAADALGATLRRAD